MGIEDAMGLMGEGNIGTGEIGDGGPVPEQDLLGNFNDGPPSSMPRSVFDDEGNVDPDLKQIIDQQHPLDNDNEATVETEQQDAEEGDTAEPEGQMGDLPDEFKAVLIDTNDPFGPMGAKSVSEISCNGAAPCIAAAIHDAVGVWIRTWPFTPEKVLRAMGRLE